MLSQKEVERRRLILFYIRNCLIGEIPKNLRLASATWDENSAKFYFYFDGKISERDKDTLGLVHTNFISNFAIEDMDPCYFEYIQVDEPNPIRYEGECFFARKERYDS